MLAKRKYGSIVRVAFYLKPRKRFVEALQLLRAKLHE